MERALVPADRAIAAGLSVVPAALRNGGGSLIFSHREREVFRLAVSGHTNGEIATVLFLPESTVKGHLSSAYRKLGAASRKNAASLLLDPESSPDGSVVLRLSVLIPTHGDADLLRKSLPVLLADPAADIEVIIINNDPQQDVRRAIGEYASDVRTTIVEMGYEGDLPRAINRGIRTATGDLVMLCNADLFPSPTYLPTLQEFFKRRPRAGAATGKLIRFDLESAEATNVIDSAGLILTRQRRLKARGEGEVDVGQFDTERELFAIDGAAMVLRRAALDDIMVDGEYLDENFVAHKEDHDLSWRVQLAGWECWYVPEAVAHHARTTRGLGSKPYLKAIGEFHRQQAERTAEVRRHAMKNQWLLLLKNEDMYNLIRDAPFIIARELTVIGHGLVFSPRTLKAIPMTIRILPETLRKRRAAKARQRMDAAALRQWIDL